MGSLLVSPPCERGTRDCGCLETGNSKQTSGCFAHYASLRQHDATLDRFEKANDWLGAFDAFSAAMWGDGEFALAPYLPYTLVAFYPLFQERGAPKVERSSDDWEVR